MSERRFTVDDLPRFSPWPARLLGLERWEQRYKTPQELTREYEHEKWGPLLKKLEEADHVVSLAEVNDWSTRDAPSCLCSIEDSLELMPTAHAQSRHLEIIAGLLRGLLPASALVELGCGYGNIILDLAKQDSFSSLRLMAAEYAASGVGLVQRLAVAENIDISVGYCDFRLPRITDLQIPSGALIFTSFAVSCVPILSPAFVEAISLYRPKAVVHFEPCYDHLDTSSLLGLMRRRYIEVNDYNRNLAALLREQQKLGILEILEERPAVFGPNPLLPASIVIWAPRVGSDGEQGMREAG